MTEQELASITKRFTKAEIEKTGAKLADVNFEAFKKMVKFRELIKTEVYFVHNGITTGNHKSPGHPAGKAYDVRVPKASFYDVFRAAIEAGFTKIGVYWNGAAYSYHLEDSEKAAFWMGTKSAPGVGPWKFDQLIMDPRKA